MLHESGKGLILASETDRIARWREAAIVEIVLRIGDQAGGRSV